MAEIDNPITINEDYKVQVPVLRTILKSLLLEATNKIYVTTMIIALYNQQNKSKMVNVLKLKNDKIINHLNQIDHINYEKKQCFIEKMGERKDVISKFNKQATLKLEYIAKSGQSKSLAKTLHFEAQKEKNQELLKIFVQKIDQEEKINSENVKYLREVIIDLKNIKNEWDHKTIANLSSLNKKINHILQETENIKNEKDSVLDLFQKREEQIIQYKIHKECLAKKKEELDRKNRSATMIQAWWRGVIVRKGFGRFRKKKDKRTKKEKTQ